MQLNSAECPALLSARAVVQLGPMSVCQRGNGPSGMAHRYADSLGYHATATHLFLPSAKTLFYYLKKMTFSGIRGQPVRLLRAAVDPALL